MLRSLRLVCLFCLASVRAFAPSAGRLLQANPSALHNTAAARWQPRHHQIVRMATAQLVDSGRQLGTLSLVGAGPGDPDLLTVKAARALASAELVIADRLISKEILDLVTGELRVARKHPGCAEEAQTEIYRWVKEGVEAGKRVVRLKIGDPFVFGRGGEEVLAAREWGIECDVVPGISSVFSAPLLAGIPVTHRGVANQVVLGTGYARDYGTPDISDFHPQQTAVFLMAVGRLKELCADLKRRGYPGDTPVAIIESASTPAQRVIAGKVDTIINIALDLAVRAPATIVVGEVVSALHGPVSGLVQDRRLEHDVVNVAIKDGIPSVITSSSGNVVTAASQQSLVPQ
jgi:uroporphyrin-III C-methyltransferase